MIWTGLLIWVAKQLISYFLKTNIDLSRQLDEAVKRTEEHQANLAKLEDRLEELIQDEQDTEEDIKHIDDIIKSLDAELEQKWNELTTRQSERNEIIDKFSDDDVLHADLPSTGNGGQSGNPA